jgi:hypothetical protein
MATHHILPPSGACSAPDIERWIAHETEALAVELFVWTYGLGWEAAWNQAIGLLAETLAYAAEWDAAAGPPITLALEMGHVTR